MKKLRRLGQLSVALCSSEEGSVAVQFGIVSIVLIGVGGSLLRGGRYVPCSRAHSGGSDA